MKSLTALIIIVCLSHFAVAQQTLFGNFQSFPTPTAPKQQHLLTQHADTRNDEYYWLHARDSAPVVQYINEENAYYDKVMQPTEALQQKLYNEMLHRIKQDDNTVPYFKNGYFYYTRYETGRQYPVFCRKKGSEKAPEEIMVDANIVARHHPFCIVTGVHVSPDNRYVLYAVDTTGRYLFHIYIKDLQTKRMIADNFPSAFGEAVWANDSKTIFYNTKDPVTLRADKIWKHVLGTNITEDKLVYEEKDETAYTGVSKSKSDKYIFISSGYTQTYETQFIPADHPEELPKVIAPRQKDFYYNVENSGDSFYIRTNDNHSINFRLVSTPVNNYSKENWRDVIPHRDSVLLQNFNVFKDYLVLNERINGILKVRVIGWKNGVDRYIPFNEPTYVAELDNNPEMNTNIVRFNYSSLTTPNTVIDYNMQTGAKTIRKVVPVIGYNKDEYVTDYIWATARDGVKVPVSILYKKGMVMNGNNPCLLCAYGCYGYSWDPSFDADVLSLIDRGFIYAIAHVRGGSEMGFHWYEDGKLFHRMNTFNDFIDCAQYLIQNKYTSSSELFADGISAGGELMCGVANMRSDLFKGIIARSPWVDVITSMSDPSIPLTTGEYAESGNPADSAMYFDMKRYSPYDNVTAKDYTNLLITTSYNDSQVQYFKPTKLIAKLRALKTDRNLLLLYCNMHGAHGGSSGLYGHFHDDARKFAFMLGLLNIDK